MVSKSCITVVKQVLKKTGLPDPEVSLGEINLDVNLSPAQLSQIRSVLLPAGFELLEDKKDILVDQVKTFILQTVYHSNEPLIENLSVYLSRKLGYDYTYLSNLFSNKQGSTIEKFYICCKIERIKELLRYSKLSLTDIAYRMHYSSVAHLSTQFKKIAGMTPSEFKRGKVDMTDLLSQQGRSTGTL